LSSTTVTTTAKITVANTEIRDGRSIASRAHQSIDPRLDSGVPAKARQAAPEAQQDVLDEVIYCSCNSKAALILPSSSWGTSDSMVAVLERELSAND
jgi:hypothetical protein